MVRRDTRREEILAMTLEQIGHRGIAATRVQDVAGALGISTALVHYHFSSKDELMAAAFELFAQRDRTGMERLATAPGSPAKRMQRFLREMGPTGAASNWRLWIDTWSASLADPKIRTSLRELDAVWVSTLERLIVEGNEAGEFGCPDPRDSAQRLVAAMDGMAVAYIVMGRTTRTALRQSIAQLAAFELRVPVESLTAA